MEKQNILEALKSYKPGTVYNLSSSNYIEQGLSYYNHSSVNKINWERNFLLVYIEGAEEYIVKISINKDSNLIFYCDCFEWIKEKNCHHVICSMMTVLNLINPENFERTNYNKKKYQTLKAKLLETEKPLENKVKVIKKPKLNLKIHIIPNKNGTEPTIKVLSDNKQVNIDSKHYPAKLKNPYSFYYNNQPDFELFINFFKKNRIIPIFIDYENKLYEVFWQDEVCFERKITFNLNKKSIVFDSKISDSILKLDSLYVDLKNQKIGFEKKSIANSLWKSLLYEYSIYEVNTRYYNLKPIAFYSNKINFILPNITFMLGNVEQKTIDEIKVSNILNIQIDSENNSVTLCPAYINKQENALKYHFSLIYKLISSGSSTITTKKRLKVLQKNFLEIIFKPQKKITDIISETLKCIEVSHSHYNVLQYIEEMLYYFYQELYGEKSTAIITHQQKWHLFETSNTQLLKTFFVPLTVYEDKMIKQDFLNICENLQISIATPDFMKYLEELYKSCKKNDIQLCYNGKHIQQSSLDIKVEVSKTDKLDWFSLTPNILHHKKRINDKQWLQIIENGGIFQTEGTIEFIDKQTIKKLQAISDIYDTNKQKENKIIHIPRLHIFDWLELKNKGIKINIPVSEKKLIDNLLNLKQVQKTDLPKKFKGNLRDYQKQGLYWIGFLYQHRFGACLADDMGLGKTIQAIAFMAQIKESILKSPYPKNNLPILIVVPPSLLFNWHHELNKFYPNFKILEYIGNKRTLKIKNIDIILSTYDIIRIDSEKLKAYVFQVIIFDEAQFIKNISAKRTSAVRILRANFKLCLTGTPVENHLGEYYSIMDLAIPGIFGKYDQYLKNIKKNAIDRYIKRSKPFILRRKKKEILKDLPPKIESNIYFHLTDHQKSVYTRVVAEIREEVAEAYKYKPAAQAGIIALTALLRLRQICITPQIIDKNDKQAAPKIEYLISKLYELNEEGHCALIFSQFTSALDIIEHHLKQEKNLNYIRMDGKTATTKRKTLVENFQKKDGPSFFLISLKTGGVGLNLTRASYVFHVDPWWNPAVENQASDRAHRIGQNKKVQVFRLIMHDTVEEKMMILKQKKAELYEKIMQGSIKSELKLSKEDFQYLIE